MASQVINLANAPSLSAGGGASEPFHASPILLGLALASISGGIMGFILALAVGLVV